MKNNIIGLKELRENTEKYISKVQKGASFTVVKKSKPVFRISPPGEENEAWETVADLTKIKREGVSAKDILKELRQLNA